MSLYFAKYLSSEDQTATTDCTNLSCTFPYEIRHMKTLQFFKHFRNNFVLRKILGFAEMLEISTFLDFSTKFFQ